MSGLADTYCSFCGRLMGDKAPTFPDRCYGDCDGAREFWGTVTTNANKQYIKELEKGNQNQRACLMILEGAIDAPHHRQWYLDNALRLLAGSEYTRLIAAFESTAGIEWDTGIAP